MPGYTASNCLLKRTEGTDQHKLIVEAKYAPERVSLDLQFDNGLWKRLNLEQQALDMQAAGMSGNQIAKALGRRREVVSKWLK